MEKDLQKQIRTQTKRNKSVRIAKTVGLVLCFALIAGLTVHSLLCVFKDDYYPTFGRYRLFAVVTDSMEPNIPVGSMIVSTVPTERDKIREGDIITYAVKTGGSTALYTHRVAEVRVSENGVVSYITKGDNAPDVDAIRPRFENIVGVYTGKKCGFFGYIFGFLRSAEGAIALIIIALISVLACVVVRFVNLVSTWRKIAVDALAKSRGMLADTQDEKICTVADVIGIVSKDPDNKADLKRKDKKLGRFIRTGALPNRPYSNDIDDAENEPEGVFSGVAQNVEEINAPPPVVSDAAKRPPFGFFGGASKKTDAAAFALRLVSLDDRSKAWYAKIKNELMSYTDVRARLGKRCETFTLGKKAVARLSVRGKTLRLSLAVDPAEYDGTKYNVTKVRSTTPSLFKIKSGRKAEYALDMIRSMLSDAEKDRSYTPRDYYLSLDGIVAAK